ncbi:PREDICTED: uncharacterized protein LOC105144384 isoform X2 [Acromyrmex echinatior]|uniref:uncharacterized protein LOC105144384 isoform X2 n=1 Tax=Acromyrmex echinatior TaxID=103372 RepID=UPI000580C9CF|nr:PREDICTED: uncharacterized protein LOC105144384 isoform X2 [Acromyrmex echinatior]
MEVDMNINDILQVLREMITFLECLGDAQLPLTLESLREKLLIRSKNTLGATQASSPEPYLDMKSGLRSLLLTKSEADSEEYIGMEESQKRTQIHPRTYSHQDYYETFENNGSLQTASASSITNVKYLEQSDDRDEGGQMLMGIYKNVSAMQIKSKCYKCGPLYRKEGKKLFLSESRACWIALVGSHLLIYRSERHNRPYAIYSIRGYKARPAPNMIPRDRQKSESAFEIYSPGNQTLQFIARTPQEMDQWIAKICEVECCNESERNKAMEAHEKKKRATIVESSPTDHSRSNEATRHQDADKKLVSVDNSTAKAELPSNRNKVERKENTDERTPSLPARIPRRLPSLPPDNEILTVSSHRATVDGDDDDDDDIYHRIEDLRNEMRYQNIVLPKEKQVGVSDEKQEEAIAYDDIGARNKKNERNEKVKEDKSCDAISSEETYDDIVTLLRINATKIEPKRNLDNDSSIDVFIADGAAIEKKEEFYDDVESLISHERFAKDRVKIETSCKLQQKKSFLNRVLSRRESPSKETDKKERYRCKDKISSNSALSLDTEKIPTYDDVSDLKQDYQVGFLTDEGEELSEYNHLPAPRPIYQVKLPVKDQNETQEFYDDVSAHQEGHKNPEQSTRDSCSTKVNEAELNAMFDTESETNTREETEHYQSPKSDLCVRDDTDESEQLYDDIALWADFTARQRDIIGKRETEDAKSVSLDKKTWTRFANRKSRITSDFNCSTEPNKRGGNEGSDEVEDSPENSGTIKRNTFQKLISRMENSFAKVSARSPSSVSTGKSSVSSNSS